MLRADFMAKAKWLYGRTDSAALVKAAASDGSLAMVLYRAMSACHREYRLKPVAALLCKLNSFACGAVIGRDARFGEGFVILHSQGVVVNSRVEGGRGVILESGVVIGESGRGCPRIGDSVFFGSGAKVFGSIRVGSNVTIGANAVVNRDFPDNVVVAGVPAKVVRVKKPDETEPAP